LSDTKENDLGDAIDPKSFWRALGVRAIGGAVVTAAGAEGPAGFLALSVTHLAQNPPTLLVSIGKSTSALATVLEARHFAVNYLATADAGIADVFAGKTGLKGADRFAPRRWQPGRTGAPLLVGGVGALECRLLETIERFETVIAIGLIVGATANPDAEPLVYFQGKAL
jgi:flavin reductase (DIM6/NTAB) family NADH-FMN oxidoreductase RutF